MPWGFSLLHQILSIPQPLLHSTLAYLTFKTLGQAWRDDIFEMLTGNWYFPCPPWLPPSLYSVSEASGLGWAAEARDKRSLFLAFEFQKSVPSEQEGFITKLKILETASVRGGRKGSFSPS